MHMISFPLFPISHNPGKSEQCRVICLSLPDTVFSNQLTLDSEPLLLLFKVTAFLFGSAVGVLLLCSPEVLGAPSPGPCPAEPSCSSGVPGPLSHVPREPESPHSRVLRWSQLHRSGKGLPGSFRPLSEGVRGSSRQVPFCSESPRGDCRPAARAAQLRGPPVKGPETLRTGVFMLAAMRKHDHDL